MSNINPDGHFFVCKLCGHPHEVPEQCAPYWRGATLRNILIGDVEWGCERRPGTAKYSFLDFQPYQLTEV